MADGAGSERITPAQRAAAVDALSEAFASDVLSMDEFEQRVEMAQRASTAGELRVLLSDLPRGETRPAPRTDPRTPAREAAPLPAPAPARRQLPAEHVEEQNTIIGILGAGVRKGQWIPARMNTAIAVLGGVELDFREAALQPGVTELRCFTFMGGVEIIVPPDVVVQSSGAGIMGGFEHHANEMEAPEGAPVLRISGLAFMAGVEVEVRYPGESKGEAKRRRRMEKRDRRRRLRSGS